MSKYQKKWLRDNSSNTVILAYNSSNEVTPGGISVDSVNGKHRLFPTFSPKNWECKWDDVMVDALFLLNVLSVDLQSNSKLTLTKAM